MKKYHQQRKQISPNDKGRKYCYGPSPLFVLTAMNASQHMTDQVLLGVFSFVRGEIKENGLHWGVCFSYPK